MELEQQFIEITHLIASAKARAYQAINKELVSLYWGIGNYLSKNVHEKGWGKSVIIELAAFIQEREQNIKGFSSKFMENETIL